MTTKNKSGKGMTAKLVELLGNDLNSRYMFKRDSFNFTYAPREDNPCLTYLTFSNKLDEKDVKDVAMKTLENNYKDNLFVNGEGILYRGESIEELKNHLKPDTETAFEQLKAKNFYNPAKFSQDSGNFKSLKGLMGAISGSGIAGLFTSSYFTGGALILGSSGLLEILRRSSLKDVKEELNSINQDIEFYDNFKRNIENSNVKIFPVEEAEKVYSGFKESKENSIDSGKSNKFLEKPSIFDIDRVNKRLIEIYKKY